MDLIQVLHIALALVTLVVPAVGIVLSISQRTKHPGGVALVVAGCALLAISALARLAWLVVAMIESIGISQLNVLGAVTSSVDSLATALGIGLLIAAVLGRRRGPVSPMRPGPPPPGAAQAQWGQWGAPRS